jgi:SAM-dependent methyltransferase
METQAHPAAKAYANFAPFYDRFTYDYAHGRWLGRLAALAEVHGVRGGRALDVGCGTGKSLRPLLALGYEAEGCDISPAMLKEATRLLPSVRFFEADMRDLPRSGPYAWITCIDDAVNHLLEDDDLERALASMAAVLAPDGVLTFDVNTLMTHRAAFDSAFVVRHEDTFVCWNGCGRASRPGEVGRADIAVFVAERDRAGWRKVVSTHHERWWSDAEIETAAKNAGLAVVGRYGQRKGAIVEDGLDQRCHAKVVYYIRHACGPTVGA